MHGMGNIIQLIWFLKEGMAGKPRRAAQSEHPVGARHYELMIGKTMQQVQGVRSGAGVWRIQVKYNHGRTAGPDKVRYSLGSLRRLDPAGSDVPAEQHERHEIDDIRIPEDQRNVCGRIHGVR